MTGSRRVCASLPAMLGGWCLLTAPAVMAAPAEPDATAPTAEPGADAAPDTAAPAPSDDSVPAAAPDAPDAATTPATSAPPATASPPPPRPDTATLEPPTSARGSAFGVRARNRTDAYGQRPADVPRLTLSQIVRYALENPAVRAAEEDIHAMEAQLRKAKFAWVPIIETRATLSPGVNIRCDDIQLDDGTVGGFDFQYCRTRDDNDFDINTIKGYFSQLSSAGVRFEFRADMIIPITTFGKIRNLKRTAEVGVALRQLKKQQVEQESVMRVHQAHTALLLARESIAILDEAKGILDTARRRVEKDLGGDIDEDWDADPDAGGNDLRDPDDLLKVKLAGLELEQKMREALKIEALALASLWALAGEAAPPGFDVDARALRARSVPDGVQSVEDYTQMAVARRPEARLASAAVKAREYQEKLARANFYPDLGIAVSAGIARSNAVDTGMTQLYYQDNFNWTRFSAALALRWKWDFHFKAFDLQTARATTRSAMRTEEAAHLLLGLDVQKAHGDLTEAQYQIETYEEAVDLSWRLVVSGQQKDTIGGGNASDLLKSLEKWYQRRFERASAIHAYNDALARLSRAVGTEIGAVPDAHSASPQTEGTASKAP